MRRSSMADLSTMLPTSFCIGREVRRFEASSELLSPSAERPSRAPVPLAGTARPNENGGGLENFFRAAVGDMDTDAGMSRRPEVPAFQIPAANLCDRLDRSRRRAIRHPDSRLSRRGVAQAHLRPAVSKEPQVFERR